MILQFLPQLLTLVLCVFSRKNIHPPPSMKHQVRRLGGCEGGAGPSRVTPAGSQLRAQCWASFTLRAVFVQNSALGICRPPHFLPVFLSKPSHLGPSKRGSRHCTPLGAKATCPSGWALARPQLVPSVLGLFLPWSRGCVLSPSRRSRCASHSHLALPSLRAASAFVPQERR